MVPMVPASSRGRVTSPQATFQIGCLISCEKMEAHTCILLTVEEYPQLRVDSLNNGVICLWKSSTKSEYLSREDFGKVDTKMIKNSHHVGRTMTRVLTAD